MSWDLYMICKRLIEIDLKNKFRGKTITLLYEKSHVRSHPLNRKSHCSLILHYCEMQIIVKNLRSFCNLEV